MDGPREVLRTITATSTPERDHLIDESLLLPVLDENRFVLGEERARGGIGRILEADDELLGRRVAVKQLIREGVDQARFLREASITARLQHPAIVPIYDAGLRRSGELFYTMPLVPGRSLREAIEEARTLDSRLALLSHVQAVADAVAYAHDQGIFHRDLKPANVLVGPYGETLVIDWGLAKDLRAADEGTSNESSAESAAGLRADATRAGAVLGTPAYMAPEQARGEPATRASDVYAIGAMLYQLLTGHSPHPGGGPLARPIEPIDRVEPGVPRDLVAIVAKAMADEPALRYATAQELASDLRRFATGQLVGARRYSRWALARRWLARHRTTVIVAAILLAALATNATVSARRIVRDRDRAEAENRKLRFLHLLQAEALADRDPTSAAAWLAVYRPDPEAAERTAAVAARALDAGVATWVLRLPDEDAVRVCVAEGAGQALLLGRSGSIWRFDLRARTRVRLDSVGALPAGCAFSGDGNHWFAWASNGGLRVGEVGPDARPDVWTPPLPAGVSTVAADGSGPAVVVSGGRAFVVDVAARELRPLAGLPEDVVHVVLAHDGTTAFATDARGGLWQAGATAALLERLDGPATSLVLSPDGGRLVLATGHEVIVRDLATGKLFRKRFEKDTTDPIVARPAAARRVLFISAVDQSIALWEPERDELQPLGDKASWKTLDVSTDGTRAAWASQDGTLFVADLTTGLTRTIPGRESAVGDADLSSDGAWLATTSAAEARIHHVSDKVEHAWTAAPPLARAVKVDHADGSVLFDETGQGRLVRVDGTTHERRVIAELGESLTSLAVMPEGRQVAVCGVHGRVAMVDLGAGAGASPVRDLGKLPALCTVVHLVGKQLRSNDKDNDLLAWEYPSLVPAANVDRAGTPPGPPTRLGPSTHPKSRVAAVVPGGASIEDTATGEHELVPLHGLVSAGNLSPDENSAVFGFYDGRLVEWRVGRREPRELARLPGAISPTLLYSPDGALIYATGDNGAVFEVRVADGQVRRLVTHEARVATLVLSRSGKRLASGDARGGVRVVDLASGAVQLLRGHTAEVRWLDFARDDQLVSFDASGHFRQWNLREEAFVPSEPQALAAWLDRLTTARIQAGGVTETRF